MSRFIVYRGNEPERQRLAIHSLRSLLFSDIPDEELLSDGSPERPVTGTRTRWGLGYYVGGEPHVQRFAAAPAAGFAALRALRCEIALGHATDVAADDNPALASPHRYGRLLLSGQSQPGTGSTVMALPSGAFSTDAPLLLERSVSIPEFLRRNMRDGGPAEILLHRFCARLHEADPDYLQAPQLPLELALAVLAAVVPPSMAGSSQQVAISNGDWLIVARRGPVPLYYRQLVGLTEGETRHESFRGLIATAQPNISRESATAAGLSELAPDQALIVFNDLSFRTQPL